MSIQTIFAWAGWLSAEIASLAPIIVGVAALWCMLIVAGQAGEGFKRFGQERLGSYVAFAIANFSVIGFFFLVAAMREATGEPLAVTFLIIDLGLWTYMDDLGWIAGLSALLFVVFTAIGGASDKISDWLGEEPTQIAIQIRPRTVTERFAWVSVMSPTAGFCEEVIFRGLLLGLALELSGDPVIAIALTSLAFGLGHAGYGLTWTVGSFVMGVTAGVSVVLSESLWPAILAHTLYDMTVYFIFEDSVPADADAAPAPVRLRWLLPLR